MQSLLAFLARPVLFFYAVPWLMLLLVVGTIAQRTAGLYAAEQTYFSSFIFWVGPLPLPGGFSVLVLITVNMLAKLLQQKRKPLGTTIAHLSVLMLLLGGGVTALLREEGFVELAPGASSMSATDYHQRELAILKNDALFQAIPYAALAAGQTIPGLPFGLRIDELCAHCAPVAAAPPATDRRGAAQQMRLVAEPPLAQNENNLAGVTFTISGLDAAQNGVYVAFAPLMEMPAVTQGNDKYRFVMRRVERPLPFTITLEQFEKTEHPGTRIASAYRSDVTITDGATRFPATIAMNTPLRYRGYTLYQSSFAERPEATSSILTVVHDRGQIFPYLAVTALCIGLVIHLVGLIKPRRRPA